MLILTRRIGETITIGRDVTITVYASKGAQVRLGVSAPRDVAVHRTEILPRIKRDQQAAARSLASALPPGPPRRDLP